MACSIKGILNNWREQWEQSLLSIGVVRYLMATRWICFTQGQFNLKIKHFAFLIHKFNILDSNVWERQQKPSILSDLEWTTSCDNHVTLIYSSLL